MKLEANITRFAPNNGYICDVEKQRKAVAEEYEMRLISPGFYLCTHDNNAYAISEYMGKIGCACYDMTHGCKGKEVCKHLVKFMTLKDLSLPEISQDQRELLEAAGWSGTVLTPPQKQQQPKQQQPKQQQPKQQQPKVTEPAVKSQPQATRIGNREKYEGKTPAQIIAQMPLEELKRNARKGGVMAVAELQRRTAEEVSA